MTDNDITLWEVYRAVLALQREVREGRLEAREGHDRLRDDVTTQGLAIREHEVRLDSYMGSIQELKDTPHKDMTARWTAIGSFVGAILAAIGGGMHK